MGEQDNNPVESGTVDDTALSIDGAATAFEDLDDDFLDEEQPADEVTDEGEAESDDPEDQNPEADDDGEGEGEGDEAEEEPAGEYAGDDVQVELQDGTITTIADLKAGNLMQADYTRKTQELAQLRDVTEDIQRRSLEWGQYFEQQANALQEIWSTIAPQQPTSQDWEMNPGAAREQMERFQYYQAVLEQVREVSGQAQEVNGQQQAGLNQASEQREKDALFSKRPDLTDPAVFKAFQATVVQGLDQYGFTREEIAGVTDHRMLDVAHDAAKWRELQANKNKARRKAKTVPPVGSSKRSRTAGERKRRSNGEAMGRLRKSGRVQDAAAVFMDIDDDEV